jgi:hypothetical protein
MANTVTKAAVYNAILDEVVSAGLTSAPLTANQSRLVYNGGNSVKIAKLSTDGYSDYSRANGYTEGSATLTWEDHTIRMDRGKSFNIDVMDADETMQTLSATNLIGEFAKDKEVPEVDAYRYSSIFGAIVNDATVRYGYYTPAADTLLTTFQGNVADIQDAIGEQEPLIAFMSMAAWKYLTTSTELSKQLMVRDGGNGINTKTYEIDGVRIVPVPSARMKTEYTFGNNGFAAKDFAQDMNWIIMSQNAAVAFVKHQKVKVVSAEDNQSADAEKIMMRLYHDCWVYENKHNAIYVSLKTATIAGFDSDVLTSSGATNASYTLGDLYTNREPGHEFWYLDGGSETELADVACYDDLDTAGWVKIETTAKVQDETTSEYYNYLVELDENGRIIRRSMIQTAASA